MVVRLSRGAEPQQQPRSSGPAGITEIERAAGLLAGQERRPAPRARLSGNPDRSTTGSANGAAGWITCTGEPSRPSDTANTVRNASCRRTISPKASASTATRRGPSTRSATGML